MSLNPTQTWSCNKLAPAIEPGEVIEIQIKLLPNKSYVKGTVMGEIAANIGTFDAYASGNNDGTQNPKGVLEYDCQTDASGNIVNSATAGQVTGEHGRSLLVTQLYIRGYFRCEELVGLDANAVTKLGFLKRGTTANGLLHIA